MMEPAAVRERRQQEKRKREMPSAVAQSRVIDNRSAGAWWCRTNCEGVDQGSGRQVALCRIKP